MLPWAWEKTIKHATGAIVGFINRSNVNHPEAARQLAKVAKEVLNEKQVFDLLEKKTE